MDKTSKAYQLFVCLIILLATLFHGCFFSAEYVAMTVIFLGLIIFSKDIVIPQNAFYLIGIVILYYLSSVFSGYNTGSAITESTKPVLLLVALIIGVHLKKSNFIKSVIITSIALGIIGLLSLCRVIDFNDFVYIYDGVKSLQSTMQYANSTAVILICGIFSLRALDKTEKHNYICSVTEIALTICLLFTHSRIALAVYVLLTISEQLMLKNGIPLKLLIHSISSVCIYFCMQFLLNSKLSFVALIVCIISVLLIAEAVCKIQKSTIKVNRIITVAFIAVMLLLVLGSFYFIDISTIMARLLYYIDGTKALLQNPVWGLSPGGWGIYQYNYQSAQYFVNQVHNGVLQVGLDAGIIAMLLFIALLVISLIGLVKIWIKDKKTNDLYILLIFSTLSLHGFWDFDFSYGNILIILGICCSYGCRSKYQLKSKKLCKSFAVIFSLCFICLIVAETALTLGQSEYSKENYQSASEYYELAEKIRPFDVDSKLMRNLCQENLGNSENTKETIVKIYKQHPNNRDIILKTMGVAADANDFQLYIDCQTQLLNCAPMQQSTYSNSMHYIEHFYQNKLLDEALYLKEKDKVTTAAIRSNKKMSEYNQHLDYGAEIDINF